MSYESPSGPSYGTPSSSLAIISLIAGITGITIFPFIGSIVAVITGSMAKKEIYASRGAVSGEGLANAGAILGWIGIALGIIACCLFLAILAIPAFFIPFGAIMDGNNLIVPAFLLMLP